MTRLASLAILILWLAAPAAFAADPLGGWRGNGTGIWPKGNPPLTWHRTPKGAMEGLRAQTNRPTKDQPGDAPTVEKGQIRQWLVLGTFPVKDALGQFDSDPLGGEGSQQPSVGERIAE